VIRRARYPAQALVLYAALGIAMGLIAWALWIHDGGSNKQASGGQAPAAERQGR
jgi:hypothetical protein